MVQYAFLIVLSCSIFSSYAMDQQKAIECLSHMSSSLEDAQTKVHLLKEHHLLNQRAADKLTPLYRAVIEADIYLALALIVEGAQPELGTIAGITPFQAALTHLNGIINIPAFVRTQESKEKAVQDIEDYKSILKALIRVGADYQQDIKIVWDGLSEQTQKEVTKVLAECGT